MAPDPTPAAEGRAPRGRRRLRVIVGVLLLAIALLALVLWLFPTARVAGLLVGRVGASLGLEITASGANELRLRDMPTLVLRDVVARERGAAAPLFRASRVFVSLPWSTLRARGARLDATRLELDAPVIDLPALQHWLATRPPTAEKRLPSLQRGLRVHDGRVLGDGWRIDDIAIDAPHLLPSARFDARVRARIVADPLQAPLDVAVSLGRPDALLQARATGFGLAGTITVQHGRDWRLPARVLLAAPLRIADTVTLSPARIGISARYETGATRVPFALGLRGPLRIGDAVALAPATLVVHGQGAPATDPVPRLQAQAVLAWQRRLVLQLRGTLAGWPASWPTLPAPLGTSDSPLPVALAYAGRPDFSDPAQLALIRDDTRFDARFRLPDVTAWLDGGDAGSPLPPLEGHLVTPRLDIGGVQLEGVDADIGDDGAVADCR